MKISDKDIEYIANLAKIELGKGDKERLQEDFNEITKLFEPIEEIEVTKDSEYEFGELRNDECINETNTTGALFYVPRIVG